MKSASQIVELKCLYPPPISEVCNFREIRLNHR